MAEIGDLKVTIKAETRDFERALQRMTRLVAGEPTVWDLVRTDPSVTLFWALCILIPAVLAASFR